MIYHVLSDDLMKILKWFRSYRADTNFKADANVAVVATTLLVLLQDFFTLIKLETFNPFKPNILFMEH